MRDINEVLTVIKLISQAIIENGGETSRAEEVCERICKAYNIKNINAFAIPTGIIITVGENDEKTVMKRIKNRSINFEGLERANDISYKLVRGDIDLKTAREMIMRLVEEKQTGIFKKLLIIGAGGLSTGFFTALMGGGIFDFTVAFFCGIFIQIISLLFKRNDLYQFLISMLGGMFSALFAVLAVFIFKEGNMDFIISGAIMLLLPGLAMTSAIRDTMSGNLLAGTSKIGEALLTAVAIAGGVGAVLSVFAALGGNII